MTPALRARSRACPTTASTSREITQRGSDYGETTFGTELRYCFSRPALRSSANCVYSARNGTPDDSTQDINTYFLLVGGEWTLSRRFTSSLRIGNSYQTYPESGNKSNSPYFEGTLDYRLARATTLEWNARYGFENSGNANTKSTVARTGLVLTQIFSPRLQASLSLNLIHNQMSTTEEVADTGSKHLGTTSTAQAAASPAPAPVPTPTPAPGDTPRSGRDAGPDPESPRPGVAQDEEGLGRQLSIDTIDATLGFHCTVSRHWAFKSQLYLHHVPRAAGHRGLFYRQQVFLGAEFQF